MGQEPSPWRALGALFQMGITFVVATALGLLAGYWVDQWLGSSPWLTLLGLGFGIASGFVNLFRSVKATERDNRDES
jgi:F0F1-type ATP synthase assembly protein I